MNKNNFYRPEIDGLRAISVISVLIYHLEISINHQVFSGGFLGVDIFFVISGYLITSIILTDIEAKKFSLSNFIKRRIRRIIPILFVVILLTTIAAWFILLPSSLVSFSKSTLYTVLFNSNFFFWHDVFLKYSHEQAQLYPLLHTWSLAIEEQYYIIFPIVLLFLIKFLKKYTLLALILTVIVSLSLAQIFINKYPSFTFYMLPFRIWEILIGSICAYLFFYKSEYILKKNIIAFIGLILILLSFVLFNKNTPHPSIFTLIPIMGVVSIILCYDSSEKNLLTKILANNLMVKLGLISYSLYLVHFPVFSLTRRVFNFEYYNIKIVLIILSLIISIFLFEFIEKPLRNKNFEFKKVSLFCIFLLLIIFTLNISIIKNDGYTERLKLNPLQEKALINKNDHSIKKYNFNKSDVIVIGNSHAIDFEKILINTKLFKDKNISRLNVQISCLKETIQKNYLFCQRFFDTEKNKNFENQIKLFKDAKYIILKTRWSNNDIDKLEANINYLKKLNKKILVVGPNPEFSWVKPKKVFLGNLNILQNQLYNTSQPFDKFVLSNKKKPNLEEIEQMKEQYFNLVNLEEFKEKNEKIKYITDRNKVSYLNFFKLACNIDIKKCDYLDFNRNKIYRTHQGHFTKEGKNYFSKLLENKIFF